IWLRACFSAAVPRSHSIALKRAIGYHLQTEFYRRVSWMSGPHVGRGFVPSGTYSTLSRLKALRMHTETVTDLLIAWNGGDPSALDRLIPLVKGELRRLAKHQMRREGPGHTLQTTALVNEVYLKLVDQTHARWHNRAHFFSIAAQIMRRILIDYARRNLRGKRGGGAAVLTLDEAAV